MFWLFVVLVILLEAVNARNQCSFPAPAKGFEASKYEGKWYEIGKVQTKGGAFFERKCVCTQLDVTINDQQSLDGIAVNECRESTVDGKWTNVTGQLTDADINQPGRWLETIYGSPVNYTVIYMDDDYSVEYDCGTSLGITNYCIHILSRTTTMPKAKFDELMKMAEDMGLNPQNLDVQMTLQEGCQSNEDLKCCSTCTEKGTSKYWSIDDRFDSCGEGCYTEEDAADIAKFEKNFLPATGDNPCYDSGYKYYEQTETHGNPSGNGKVVPTATFDMYKK